MRDMYIVDVNYFPGYNGMRDFHDILLRHLVRCAEQPQVQPQAAPTYRVHGRWDDDTFSTSSESDVDSQPVDAAHEWQQ